MHSTFSQLSLRFLALGLCFGVQTLQAETTRPATLKDAFHGRFYMGVSVNAAQFTGKDAEGARIIESQFNSITPENALKWMNVHPKSDRYDFSQADQFVEFGTKRGMFIVGHTLLWHSQTPGWVFKGEDGKDASKEVLLGRLKDHVRTVVGRYKGKIKGWDVANESITDDGKGLRLDRPWYRILGEEAIEAAFLTAHEADPEAELYYNDYSLEDTPKREAVIRLLQRLRSKGIRIDAVGTQDHFLMNEPSTQAIDDMFSDFKKAGFKVMVTELDISVLPRPNNYTGAEVSKQFEKTAELNPYKDQLPPAKEAELARRYAEVFAVYLKHSENLKRVTLWGASDKESWLNHWPIRGRTDYPLLFDRNRQPKAAHQAVIDSLQAVKKSSAK